MNMRAFKNGLLLGCSMSGTGEAGGSQTLNTPNQPSMSSTGGSVTNLGGTLRVQAGQEVTDASATGSAAAETDIDPATGQPKVAQAATTEEVKPAATTEETVKTPEELAAEAEGAKVPEGSKTGLTNKQIADAEAEATKTDARFVPYTKEFMTAGDLSPESITKAAKDFGVSEAIVQAWVNGQKAEMQIGKTATAITGVQSQEAALAQTKTVNEIKALVGTDAEYTEFQMWANANYTDMPTLVDAINTNNPGLYKMAMSQAKAAWKAAGNGVTARDLSNGALNTGAQGPQGFKSAAEQSAAINDPKYSRDAVYREEVAQKIAASRF